MRQTMLDPDTAAQLTAGAIAPTAALDTVIRLVLIQSESRVRSRQASACSCCRRRLPPNRASRCCPMEPRGIQQGVDLSDMLHLAFEGTVRLDGGIGALVRPGKDIELLTGFGPGTPSAASGTVSIALRVGKEGEPTVILGTADASHFELIGASALGGARFHSGGKYEVFVELGVQGAKIVIKPGPDDSDSFLAKLLPGDGLSIGTDLTVGFSTTQGLYFGGSGGLEISLPAHISLGPVEIMAAMIAVRFRTAASRSSWGPRSRAISRCSRPLSRTSDSRRRSPSPRTRRATSDRSTWRSGSSRRTASACAIDAGVVKGGGYLFLDFDKGEYAGALELTIANFLSLKAIGLINTKLPGGQPGFSLLIIITAEFSPGFQLGYGFTLIGVGGLLGLNRAVLLDPLAQGVRTGAVNSILFPTNIIANAPKILSDLRAIFPPVNGKFLIGPMAKIGWGTPTLISVSLGVIIEIPGNIVILGRLALALPTADEPVCCCSSRSSARWSSTSAGSGSSPRSSTRGSCSSRSTARWGCSSTTATTRTSCCRSAASTRS